MHKPIHRSWQTPSGASSHGARGPVALDFSGVFAQGPLQGVPFAGRIGYDRAHRPTEQHSSFALFDEWPTPLLTMAVGGQIMSATGASVYHRIFDGSGRHYDFVTIYGTGVLDGVVGAASFEVYLADEDGSTLAGIHLPSAAQLCAMPVKQLSLDSNALAAVPSVGSFKLSPAG